MSAALRFLLSPRRLVAAAGLCWFGAMFLRAADFTGWSWWYLLAPVWAVWMLSAAILLYVLAAFALGQVLDFLAWIEERRRIRRQRREQARVRREWDAIQRRAVGGFFIRRGFGPPAGEEPHLQPRSGRLPAGRPHQPRSRR